MVDAKMHDRFTSSETTLEAMDSSSEDESDEEEKVPKGKTLI